MKTYNYYLVDDTSNDGWTYGLFRDFETAKLFCINLILPGSPILEIIGTDEDPDTYKFADTLWIYDTASGETIPTYTKSKSFSLAERIRKQEERFCSPGLEEEELSPIPEIIKSLETVDGCHSMIEYLLDNIEVME